MATRSQFNSKSPTIRRILREAAELSTSPSPDYTATPLDDNLFEWHFTLRGPPGDSTAPGSEGPYHDGIYHGRIVLPPTYPLRPPSFRFLTPSGRFETNREICLSISGHHEETWQPAWGLRTALVALRAFMETDPKGQLGGLECTDDVRRRMAQTSQAWKCSSCGKPNLEIIQACQEAAKLVENAKPEVVVPKELKMGWKDEMTAGSAPTPRGEEDVESQGLAEGFVQTAPQPSFAAERTPSSPSRSPPRPQHAYPPAQPGQTVPQPTATTASYPPPPAQQPHDQLPPLALRIRAQSNDGVPEWVDKAIIGLATCLVLMIAKVMLGF